MTAWRWEELERIGGAEELQLASRRSDGSLRPYVTMWVVRAAGDDLSGQSGTRRADSAQVAVGICGPR